MIRLDLATSKFECADFRLLDLFPLLIVGVCSIVVLRVALPPGLGETRWPTVFRLGFKARPMSGAGLLLFIMISFLLFILLDPRIPTSDL